MVINGVVSTSSFQTIDDEPFGQTDQNAGWMFVKEGRRAIHSIEPTNDPFHAASRLLVSFDKFRSVPTLS